MLSEAPMLIKILIVIAAAALASWLVRKLVDKEGQ